MAFFPDGTMKWYEPILTYHQSGPVPLTWLQYHWKILRYECLKWVWNLYIQNFIHISRDQWIKRSTWASITRHLQLSKHYCDKESPALHTGYVLGSVRAQQWYIFLKKLTQVYLLNHHCNSMDWAKLPWLTRPVVSKRGTAMFMVPHCITRGPDLNTLSPEQNDQHYIIQHFQLQFLDWKWLYID